MPGTPGQKMNQILRNTPNQDISPTLRANLGLQLCTPTQKNSVTQREVFTPSIWLRPPSVGQK